MQVTQIAAEGLKREYKVTVPASEIESRVQSRLEKLAKTIRLPGFRPGKAPLPLLKKQYGRSILGEVLEEAVDEGSRKTIGDNQLRPALRPKIEVTSFDEGKDLEFAMKLEVLPEVPQVDLDAIALTKLVAEPQPEKIEEAIQNFARARQKFEPLAEPRPAQDGDQLVIDFEGRIDGELFPGGAAKDFPLRLGAKAMVPGFEEQLVGATPGETRAVKITFPEDYGNKDVAGKEAVFTVTVKEVKAPVAVEINDDWAKELGFESLAELKETFEKRFNEEYQSVSRARLKRELLDQLAEKYPFEVPTGMVDLEFEAIWKQLKDEMERTGAGFEEAGKSEDELKEEYRKIAERRVRLGLILSDIGTRNEIKVEGEELRQAAVREAMRFPGQERKVLEFFQSNPNALDQLRAPIFEDKVCDFIFSRAQVSEKTVPVEELMKDPDEEEAQQPAADGEAAAASGNATA
ncbi:trigger factor [Benzoatithermus flavus]|uniref:Trigger factor n=1 Tax=Benzoatithermus flavus TaxID=3108223 RepID=A0ABU8XU30_9PROT